ncbi:MAG: hypothetical protein KBI35_09965 [Ruminococcus sp.]|nr:hypothetical protein [Ruminococcus sp.]
MSFIYAEKIFIDEEKSRYNINIFSDTKTTLNGAVKANWGYRQRVLVENYGFLKSVIIGPTCCISFAGNNTKYAQRLLTWIFEKRIVSDKDMLEKAMQLHLEAIADDIEFIICSSDTGEPCIYCIKNGIMSKNVSSAWIGSPIAFSKMQELRLTQEETKKQIHSSTLDLFNRVICECEDDSVGGFVIQCKYNGNEFIYPWRYETSVSKPRIVHPGESIQLFDTAQNGGYAVCFRESKEDVIIDFDQIDISIIYTSRYRYDEDINNKYIKHLMLPFKFRTSTGIFI